MTLGIPTYTRDHHISYFKIGNTFYFEDELCTACEINYINNTVMIYSLNVYAHKKFANGSLIQLTT